MRITSKQLKQIIKEEMGNTSKVPQVLDEMDRLLQELSNHEENDDKRERIERVRELLNHLAAILEGEINENN